MANSTPADACRPMDAATHSDSPIDVTDAIADDTVADVTDATTANDRQRWCTGDTATPAFVGSPGIPPHRHTQTTPRAQPTTDSTATPSGVHFAGVDTVTDLTDASTANDRQRWFTGDTATPAHPKKRYAHADPVPDAVDDVTDSVPKTSEPPPPPPTPPPT